MTAWSHTRQELPSELKGFKDREMRWLWRYLSANSWHLPNEADVPPSERGAVIASLIAGQPNQGELVRWILDSRKNMLVAEDHFAWLEKSDDRLLIWTLRQLEKYYSPANPHLPIVSFRPGSTVYVTPETRRDEIILAMDMASSTVEHKIKYMTELRAKWAQDRMPDSDTRWISAKNHDQLVWAWEYLTKAFKAMTLPQPVRDKDYYSCILASLDNMQVNHPAERKLFVEKMKKTWSQKKYRDSGKAKKPYYMPLSKDARSALEDLAKHHETTPHELVETLIHSTYEETFNPQPPAESHPPEEDNDTSAVAPPQSDFAHTATPADHLVQQEPLANERSIPAQTSEMDSAAFSNQQMNKPERGSRQRKLAGTYDPRKKAKYVILETRKNTNDDR